MDGKMQTWDEDMFPGCPHKFLLPYLRVHHDLLAISDTVVGRHFWLALESAESCHRAWSTGDIPRRRTPLEPSLMETPKLPGPVGREEIELELECEDSSTSRILWRRH